MKSVFIIIISLLLCAVCYADETEPIDTIPIDIISPVEIDSTITDSSLFVADNTDTVIASPKKDTILYIKSNTMDPYTLVNDSTNYENKLYQNPTKALFKSMFIPGWGQYGNKRYFKAGLYAVLDIWMIGNAIKYKGEANDFYEKYESSTIDSVRNKYYGFYENKKDSRNKYTWFAVIVSFISMFDAYVDAHLSGFPEKKRFSDINIDVSSDSEGGIMAVLQIPFNP